MGDFLSLVGVIVSVAFGVYGIWDGRDQRRRKDESLRIVRGIAHETRGLAIGIKPWLADSKQVEAINDLIGRVDRALADDKAAAE